MLIDRQLQRHIGCFALLLGLASAGATAATTAAPAPVPKTAPKTAPAAPPKPATTPATPPATTTTTTEKEPTIYHLEVVLFRSTNSQAIANERWPEVFGTASVDRLIHVASTDLAAAAAVKDPTKKSATTGPQVFRFLGQKDFKLTSTVAKLARIPNHDVMLHTAWRQPAIDLQENAAVYVFDGMLFPERPLDGSFSPVAAVPVGAEAESPEFNPPRFSGTVKLAVGRYLHVGMDVLLRGVTQRDESVNAEGNLVGVPRGAIQGYRLNEIRRVKIGEVHYFDHPAFGALVLVAATEKKGNTNVEKETVGDAPIPTAPPDD